MQLNITTYNPLIDHAIRFFWDVRKKQKSAHALSEKEDAGNRRAVTGGKQLDGFIDLFIKVAADLGVPKECIFRKGNHLPGYFRPTKNWDLIIVSKAKHLVALVELKSQVGSFGNNFNNRTEEAVGSAVDFWTAFREGAFPGQSAPWLGYLMLVEQSEQSNNPVKVNEPHYKVLSEFVGTSYIDRYKILCDKLVLERHYNNCCLVWSKSDYSYGTVSENTAITSFLHSFAGHLIGQNNLFKA